MVGVINESLLFSNTGEIQILPALPEQWETGSINGLMARTRAEVEELSWDLTKNVSTVTIRSDIAQELTLSSGVSWSYALIEGIDNVVINSGEDVVLHMNAGDAATITFSQEEIEPAPVNAPANLKAAKESSTSIKVNWEKASDAAGYEVWFADAANAAYKMAVSTTDSSYIHKSLTAGKTYYYKVRSYKKVNGKAYYSNYTNVVSVTLPAVDHGIVPPTGIKTASMGATSIEVSWKKVTGASGYEVSRSNSRNGAYKAVTTVGAGKVSYIDKNLTKGKTYYYKIRAYKTINGSKVYSSYSSIVKRKAALSKPVLTVKAKTRKAQLKWKKVAGATKYEIYRANSKKGKYKKVKTVSGKKISFINKKLTKGKKYYYKIRAVQKIGKKTYRSAYSTIRSARIK